MCVSGTWPFITWNRYGWSRGAGKGGGTFLDRTRQESLHSFGWKVMSWQRSRKNPWRGTGRDAGDIVSLQSNLLKAGQATVFQNLAWSQRLQKLLTNNYCWERNQEGTHGHCGLEEASGEASRPGWMESGEGRERMMCCSALACWRLALPQQRSNRASKMVAYSSSHRQESVFRERCVHW